MATPFHDNRVARPTEEGEPQGKLQPIASRVLMKILFAARMARWDLLRATQSLASRVTKSSRDCDVALHRLVCYINSSLDIRMQGFIGDTIAECQLWLFCDADWAGEHDSKSTSGCAKPADSKVRPKPSPKRDQDIVARMDPELDDNTGSLIIRANQLQTSRG